LGNGAPDRARQAFATYTLRAVERRRVNEVAGNPEGESGWECWGNKKNLLEAGFGNGAPDRARQAFATYTLRAVERRRVNEVAGNPEGESGWNVGEIENLLEAGFGNGAPDRIRTCDQRLRKPLLYPAELRML
jgi:hypothetical protein